MASSERRARLVPVHGKINNVSASGGSPPPLHRGDRPRPLPFPLCPISVIGERWTGQEHGWRGLQRRLLIRALMSCVVNLGTYVWGVPCPWIRPCNCTTELASFCS